MADDLERIDIPSNEVKTVDAPTGQSVDTNIPDAVNAGVASRGLTVDGGGVSYGTTNIPGFADIEAALYKQWSDQQSALAQNINPAADKKETLAQKFGIKDDDNLLVKAGLLAASGAMSGLFSASNTEKQIKAAKEMAEVQEQQKIAAENRLAQRAAYGKVGKEAFGYKDTGLLAAALKEKK